MFIAVSKKPAVTQGMDRIQSVIFFGDGNFAGTSEGMS